MSSIFICQKCGAHSPKWMGYCAECGEFGTLAEELLEGKDSVVVVNAASMLEPSEIGVEKIQRIKTGYSEVDQVLGGGIVCGSVVLFSGEPGIGKSTLLTQLAIKLANNKQHVIYVCGEESPEQVKLRIDRLTTKKIKNLFLFPETNVDAIVGKVKEYALDKKNNKQSIKQSLILIVDSIQTLFTEELSGVAGSISQLRESTKRLIDLAKKEQIPVFLVGHVTKEGTLAGPKAIEHAVDTVLYFEGERSGDLRLLHSVKNRFGPSDEVGVFQMTDKGLKQVSDLSFLVAQDNFLSKIGSAYSVVYEGTRPITVEIQSLVTKSFAPISKRIVNGLDKRRSEMLIAVLQKYLNLKLWEYDVFLNVSGGLSVKEPAVDLAVCAAIYSSYKNQALVDKSVWMGEVSLLGEVNKVSKLDKRISHANAMGLKKLFSYKNTKKIYQLKNLFPGFKK